MISKKLVNYLNLEALSLFLSLLAISGALIYYFYSLNALGLSLAIILSLGTWFLLVKHTKQTINKAHEAELNLEKDKKLNIFKKILIKSSYLILWLTTGLILFRSQSARPLISPWEVVPDYFWLVFILLSAALIMVLINPNLKRRPKIIFLSLHYLLSFSVALIVYKINYGFDPFIHQATLELIAKTGAVYPKPPYYLGEYSLSIFFNKVFGSSIYWLNRLIVPVLAAVFLPSFLLKYL